MYTLQDKFTNAQIKTDTESPSPLPLSSPFLSCSPSLQPEPLPSAPLGTDFFTYPTTTPITTLTTTATTSSSSSIFPSWSSRATIITTTTTTTVVTSTKLLPHTPTSITTGATSTAKAKASSNKATTMHMHHHLHWLFGLDPAAADIFLVGAGWCMAVFLFAAGFA